MGISALESDVCTSAAATAAWLVGRGIQRVVAIGSDALMAEMDLAGIAATPLEASISLSGHTQRPEALVVGLDRRLVSRASVELPDEFLRAIGEGRMQVVACNRDKSFPGRDGSPQPGCGVIVELVEAACGKLVDVVVGKPGTFMLELTVARLNVRMDEILVVGDSVESDVGMAKAAGAPWVLVASPVASEGEAVHSDVDGGVIMPNLAIFSDWLLGQ